VAPKSKDIWAARTLTLASSSTPGRSVIIGCGRLPSPAVFFRPRRFKGLEETCWVASIYLWITGYHSDDLTYHASLFKIILWMFQADRFNSLQMRISAGLLPIFGPFKVVARVIRVYGDDDYT
jgi:hypothetical protein